MSPGDSFHALALYEGTYTPVSFSIKNAIAYGRVGKHEIATATTTMDRYVVRHVRRVAEGDGQETRDVFVTEFSLFDKVDELIKYLVELLDGDLELNGVIYLVASRFIEKLGLGESM